jgi:ribosome-binding factor A
MPREFSRTDRINHVIQRELAALISRQVRDPRMPKFVSVSEVAATRDLSHAKVYISLLESEDQDPQEVIAILNRASGFLRSSLAKLLKLRTVPELHFVYDESMRHGNELSKLIDEAVKSDRKEPS